MRCWEQEEYSRSFLGRGRVVGTVYGRHVGLERVARTRPDGPSDALWSLEQEL